MRELSEQIPKPNQTFLKPSADMGLFQSKFKTLDKDGNIAFSKRVQPKSQFAELNKTCEQKLSRLMISTWPVRGMKNKGTMYFVEI